jgi:hypothetical protein
MIALAFGFAAAIGISSRPSPLDATYGTNATLASVTEAG